MKSSNMKSFLVIFGVHAVVALVFMAILLAHKIESRKNPPAAVHSTDIVPAQALVGQKLCLESKVYVLYKSSLNSDYKLSLVLVDGKPEQCVTET